MRLQETSVICIMCACVLPAPAGGCEHEMPPLLVKLQVANCIACVTVCKLPEPTIDKYPWTNADAKLMLEGDCKLVGIHATFE